MRTILVTPSGVPVIADGSKREIRFPAFEQLVLVDAKIARAKGSDRIATSDFEERIAALMRGETVDLAGEGQIRFGAGFVLKDVASQWPYLGKFDPTHPTRGDHLTPAAGLVEDLPVPETAWKELCEEFLPVGPSTELDGHALGSGDHYRIDSAPVGFWRMQGMPVCDKRSREYADAHRAGTTLRHFDPNAVFEVVPTTSVLHWTLWFGSIQGSYLIEFEPDTSSIECLMTGEVSLPVGWTVADGERLPDGTWRNQPVVVGYPLTTKALIAISAAKAGLQPYG